MCVLYDLYLSTLIYTNCIGWINEHWWLQFSSCQLWLFETASRAAREQYAAPASCASLMVPHSASNKHPQTSGKHHFTCANSLNVLIWSYLIAPHCSVFGVLHAIGPDHLTSPTSEKGPAKSILRQKTHAVIKPTRAQKSSKPAAKATPQEEREIFQEDFNIF